MKHLKHLILALGLAMASPVAMAETCPRVEIPYELSTLSDFGNATDTKSKNLASHVKLSNIQTSCTYENKEVSVDIKLAFEAALGPKGRNHSIEKPFFSYPYFIAIINPWGEVIAKEVFAASMTFLLDKHDMTYYEGISQIIPVSSKLAAKNYKILIGFQLTDEQLAYNRAEIAAQTPPPTTDGTTP